MLGYRELMDCIETGGTPTSSGEDGMKALEIVVGFHLSSLAGGSPVALPIPEADRGFKMDPALMPDPSAPLTLATLPRGGEGTVLPT